MPHLRIEYSPGLAVRADIPALCRAAQEAIVGTGLFPLAGIRVRGFAADHAVVADGLPENDFAALTLTVGAGRGTADLKGAGDAILGTIRAALAGPLATTHFALSMEIRVSDPELSWKDTPIHNHLSARA